MAEEQWPGQPFYQQTDQQSPVSYLTNPSNNPTIVVHHHHNGAVNMVLMAATATLVTLLCLFLAGVTFYLIRRRRRLTKKRLEKASDFSSVGGQLELSRSIYDSDRDVDSFRHSKATCDTCSTRFQTTRPPLSYTSPHHRQSRAAPSSFYLPHEPPQQIIPDTSNRNRFSIHISQSSLKTPMLEKALAEPFEIKSADYKAAFDWDRCAFEMQEEEEMWLPNRPHSIATRQLLARGPSLAHTRCCSESATLSIPPKSHLIPSKSISKTKGKVTWDKSPLTIESRSDYFGGGRTAESSFTGNSPGYSPGQMASMASAGSSEFSLLLPASPFLVHSHQRQSYSVRAETQDWESQGEAVESLTPESSRRNNYTPRSPSASITSSFSDATAFSDPFGGSKVDLNSDFVVLSRPSPTRSEYSLTTALEGSSLVEPRKTELSSARPGTSPLISSPLKLRSDTASTGAPFQEPLTSETVQVETQKNQRMRSATITSGEVYSLETPLQTHRFNRRGAVVTANFTTSPTTTEYASLK